MPRRKAPKGCYWRGETLWGRTTVAGVEKRTSLRTGDAEIAKGRRTAWRERLIAAAHYGDDRKTWEDAVVAWTDSLPSLGIGASTATRYATSLKQLEPHLKGLYVDEIDKALIKGIVTARQKAGVTNATIKRDLTALSSVLSYCEGEDWIEANPALAQTRRVKERRDPIVLPEHADIARVIARAPGLFAKMIEAALKTGCRQGEIVGLRRPRLDMARRQITIIGKGNKLRVIDMHEAYETFRSTPAHFSAPFVFWHDDGEPYRNVASRFAAIVDSAQKAAQAEGAEFRPFPFHHLRHRFAVDYLKSGRGSIYDLQKHLGHASVKTTELYLAYLTPEEARRAKDAPAQKAAQVKRFGGGQQRSR